MMQIGGRGIFKARTIKVIPSSLPSRRSVRSNINLFALEHIYCARDVRRHTHVIVSSKRRSPSRVCFSSSTIRTMAGGSFGRRWMLDVRCRFSSAIKYAMQ